MSLYSAWGFSCCIYELAALYIFILLVLNNCQWVASIFPKLFQRHLPFWVTDVGLDWHIIQPVGDRTLPAFFLLSRSSNGWFKLVSLCLVKTLSKRACLVFRLVTDLFPTVTISVPTSLKSPWKVDVNVACTNMEELRLELTSAGLEWWWLGGCCNRTASSFTELVEHKRGIPRLRETGRQIEG